MRQKIKVSGDNEAHHQRGSCQPSVKPSLLSSGTVRRVWSSEDTFGSTLFIFFLAHWRLQPIRSWSTVDHFYPVRCWCCVIDTVRGWQNHERALSGKRRETWPVREPPARAPADKQRRSSSSGPICQRICHKRGFIVHEGGEVIGGGRPLRNGSTSAMKDRSPPLPSPRFVPVGFCSNLIILLCRRRAV